MMSPPEPGSGTDAVVATGVRQSYGNTLVLRDVGFALPAGRVLALLGPSGCGKTTLLRLVAGLLQPTAGTIRLDGRVVADAAQGTFVPPERRGLGMVFQDYALWPHLTIGGNVSFPLEMAGVPRSDRERQVRRALERVGLGGLEQRRPGDLSGGQQQRVAIARAIVGEPRLVLFDEPLSNLDRELRDTLVGEIAELVAGLGLTAIYVTHDQGEAFSLADTVAVMRGGTIIQEAPPETLADSPASPEVAEFLKLGAIAEVEAREDGWWLGGLRLFGRGQGPDARRARALLSRRAVTLIPSETARLTATVVRSLFRGDHHLLTIRVGNAAPGLELQLASEVRGIPGETVGLAIEPSRVRWFPEARPGAIITMGT